MSDPRQLVMTTWQRVLSSMKAFGKGVDARPSRGEEIFRQATAPASTGDIRFEVLPVAFLLPEKASHPRCNMFVVVSGFLEFARSDGDRHNRTSGFGTRVAYFRDGRAVIDHTCGIHYDLDATSIAHPVFHAQFAPLAAMGCHLRGFRRDAWQIEDHMRGVISTVRLPTAQMDFFAVTLQLCADHLVNSQSHQREKDRFYALRSHVAEAMAGACSGHAGVRESIQAECLRGPHWYLPAAHPAQPPSGPPNRTNPGQSGRSPTRGRSAG